MDRMGMGGDYNPGYGQSYRNQGGYQQSATNLRSSVASARPGVPYAGNQSGYSNGMMSDVTSTAGYTLSGQNDPQQHQNLQLASQELTEGR